MPITKQQFNKLAKQAAGNYAKKLKLEPSLTKSVNTLFDDIVKDFEDYYYKHGAALGLNEYQKKLEQILNDHHVKVATDFSTNLRNLIGNPSNNQQMQRKLDANIKGYAAQRSHLMSHEIIDTTRNNMEKAIKYADVQNALSSKELSIEQMTNLSTDKLKETLINRAPIISSTETQVGAETGKLLEFDTMVSMSSEIDGEPITNFTQKKIWITTLDDHTREAHVEADAQEVGIDEPFTVDDEQLMYPGDDSMGASIENTINCRCDFEWLIED